MNEDESFETLYEFEELMAEYYGDDNDE